MDKKYQALIARFDYKISADTFEKALTHHSYYGDSKEKGNSRFIFAGKTVFKGEVARILVKYYPATGTKLEHVLGNLFKEKHLDELCDRFGLDALMRHGDTVQATEVRHTAVYGFLGCLALNLSDEDLREFIRVELLPGIEHLFPEAKSADYRSQADHLAKTIAGTATTHRLEQMDAGLWRCLVLLGEESIGVAESASRRYAIKKAHKDALRTLAARVS